MITCVFEDGHKAEFRHVVADTLVIKDNKLLMVKRSSKLLEGGKWGLPGGYMERDETVVQAAAREVLEETGWATKDMTLFTIVDKPERLHEDRQNVAFVYLCIGTEKVGEPDWESDEQRWFDFADMPPEAEIAFDHASHIKLYQKYLKEKFQLPVIG